MQHTKNTMMNTNDLIFFFGLFVNKTQKTMKREEKKRQIVSILSKLIPNTYLNYKYY